MARRRMHEIEFDPGSESGAVVEEMERLAAAHDGWINLLPGVPDDAVEQPSGSAFSALFGTPQPPVSMGTWMPPGAPSGPRGHTGRRDGTATVGLMHPRGRLAVSQLASWGVPVPAGWKIRQDHARRGLILETPGDATHESVLAWMLQAGAALSLVPLTGRWKARVYLPR